MGPQARRSCRLAAAAGSAIIMCDSPVPDRSLRDRRNEPDHVPQEHAGATTSRFPPGASHAHARPHPGRCSPSRCSFWGACLWVARLCGGRGVVGVSSWCHGSPWIVLPSVASNRKGGTMDGEWTEGTVGDMVCDPFYAVELAEFLRRGARAARLGGPVGGGERAGHRRGGRGGVAPAVAPSPQGRGRAPVVTT